MKYTEIRETLRGIGTEIGKYSQSKRINANPALKSRVATGMCAGASLDWLRMVLNGGEGSRGPSDKGSAVAFLAQKNDVSKQWVADRKATLTSAHTREKNTCNDEIQELGEKVQKALGEVLERPGMTQALYDQLEARLVEKYNQEVEKTKAYYQGRMDRINTGLQKEALHRQFWLAFSQIVDNKLGIDAYSKLTIAASSASSIYGPPNGMLALTNKVVANPALEAGCGAMLGVSAIGAPAGHAVAIHRLNTGDFHFFDPNFGIYAGDSYKVMKMILFLFLKGYPEAEDGNDADNHKYEIGGRVEGDFLIYKGAGTSPPSVKVMTSGMSV